MRMCESADVRVSHHLVVSTVVSYPDPNVHNDEYDITYRDSKAEGNGSENVAGM